MPSHAHRTPVVNAPAGAVEGLHESGLHIFKGIPYAEPPVGPLRWTPPVPKAPWPGVRKAQAFGPACTQPLYPDGVVFKNDADLSNQSEDCLSLNIWAPAGAQNAPVFVWIHGGALLRDASCEGYFDGAKLAARGLVVVTINYRLGVFGYLAHAGLSAESPSGNSGNYGLLDQIEALHWVRRNIAAFGGDPANVTIAGESAGALSVMYLMASPLARGLFAKAIAQSAYMIATPELKAGKHGAVSAEDSGGLLAAALHAPNVAALRAMDAQALADKSLAAGWMPWGAIDGTVLPDQLVDIFDRGEQAPVPLLAGFNSGEIRALRRLAPPPPATPAEYESIIRGRYGDLADEFLRLYPGSDMQESIFAAIRDALYAWTAERLVRKQTALGQPAYLYLWDHGYPAADQAGMHGFHASELPYLFGTFDSTPPPWPKIPETADERRLSEAILDYWTSFARTGRPEAAGAPDWPIFGTTGAYMHFTDAPHPSEGLLPGVYAFNEEVMRRRRASGNQAWDWNVGIAAPKLPGPEA